MSALAKGTDDPCRSPPGAGLLQAASAKRKNGHRGVTKRTAPSLQGYGKENHRDQELVRSLKLSRNVRSWGVTLATPSVSIFCMMRSSSSRLTSCS